MKMFKNNLIFILLILVICIVAFKVHDSFKESADVSENDVFNNDVSNNIYNKMPKELLDEYYSITIPRSDGKRQLNPSNTCVKLMQFKTYPEYYPELCKNTYGKTGIKLCKMDGTTCKA